MIYPLIFGVEVFTAPPSRLHLHRPSPNSVSRVTGHAGALANPRMTCDMVGVRDGPNT